MHIYAVRVAIIGITGYAGRELERLLDRHPQFEVAGRFASTADPSTGVEAFSLERLKAMEAKVVVLATEHDFSMELVPELLEAGYRVLDMSGAFRLKDPALYPKWYGFTHTSPALLKEAAYGLPEVFSDSIRSARLVANPGCYATAAILPLLPLFQASAIDPESTVVVDGKSGVSGAGRKPKPESHFCEVNENIRAYGILKHRHTPEMVSWLPGATFNRFVFTPHLIPINRGILNTIVFRPRKGVSVAAILSAAYSSSPFVRVLTDRVPAVSDVVRSNGCHIGVVSVDDNTVLVSAIDNLVKGASGQAVQNLNIMCGFPETAGL